MIAYTRAITRSLHEMNGGALKFLPANTRSDSKHFSMTLYIQRIAPDVQTLGSTAIALSLIVLGTCSACDELSDAVLKTVVDELDDNPRRLSSDSLDSLFPVLLLRSRSSAAD